MNGAANFTEIVDGVFLFIGGISVILLLGIIGTMFYFVYRYHHKRNPKAANIHGSVALEIAWTVAPVILVLIMFVVGYEGYFKMRDIPDDAIPVKVTGRMWSWMFEYNNGVKTDTLYVPVGKPVKVAITSIDVNHSFYIPAFRIKADAINGHVNELWFEVNKPGSYDIACAEYCGLNHAYMYSKVVAMPADRYENWLEDAATAKDSTATAAMARRADAIEGAKLVQERGCIACHTSDGTKLIGPSFKGVYGKDVHVISGGKRRKVTVDDEYLERSIFMPNADLLEGYQPVMPPQQGVVTPEEAAKIIRYIKELQ